MSIFILGMPSLFPASSHSADTIRVQDASGQTFEYAAPLTSIISLYGAFNEILLELGAKDAIAARTDSDANIGQLAHLPSIGTHMRPDPERIIAVRPQLVLGLKGRHDNLQSLHVLQDLKIPTLFIEMDNFLQLFEATQLLGKISGHEKEANELVRNWEERLAKLREASQKGDKIKVFYEARHPNLLAAGAKGIVNAILEAAGGENVVKLPKKLARISEEWLFAANPDVYIIQEGPMNPSPEPLEQRENFMPFKGKKIVRVNEREFARPGPNSVLAAEKLAIELRNFSHENGKEK